METEVFENFRSLIYKQSGIALNERKKALVSSRIARRMRCLGLEDHRDYFDRVLGDSSGDEVVKLLDVISTNVTHFFREPQHFEFLAREAKRWIDKGQSTMRLWSAGCSSGEEPYSMAMALSEATEIAHLNLRILATDLSTSILRKGIDGVYDHKKMDGVPVLLRDRYFQSEGPRDDAVYRVADRLRRLVTFRRLNLSVVPYPMQGPMDAIFCRNVMIYFDNAVRKRLLDEFHRLLKRGGYLFVGHAESLTGMLSGLKSVVPSVYMKA